MTTFLSYHHDADGAAAGLLVAELQQAGVTVFQDVKDLRSGDRWMARLQQKIAECSAFIVLVGRDGIARWVAGEVEAALNRHFGPHDDAQRLTLHPVLLPGAGPDALPQFLALFQAERWVPGQPLPAGLVQALRERAQHASIEALLDPGRCPYMGLASFGADDALLFFGRRQETLAALRSLGDASDGDPTQPRAAGPGHVRWLQVEGHSGSGKSSLVKAGLLPMLRQGGALWPRTGFARARILGPLLPGKSPVKALARVLERGLHDSAEDRDSTAVASRLRRGDSALADLLCDHLDAGDDSAFVLLVDQFEELFTLADAAEREAFDALLAHALDDAGCPLYLVSTVRSDFIDRMPLLPRLSVRLNTHCKRWLLPPIGSEGLREAIEGPAALAGLDVSGVTEALLAEAQHEPGALPLVENALTQLWNERQGSRLSGPLLTERGGAAGLLSSGADALLDRVQAEHGRPGREGALELLLRLTHINLDDRLRHSARPLMLDAAIRAAGMDNTARGEQVLRMLTGQAPLGQPSGVVRGNFRLVTAGRDSTADGERAWVALIHESLLRARPPAKPGQAVRPYWKTLYDHIEANYYVEVLHQHERLKGQLENIEFNLNVARWQSAGPLTRWQHFANSDFLIREEVRMARHTSA